MPLPILRRLYYFIRYIIHSRSGGVRLCIESFSLNLWCKHWWTSFISRINLVLLFFRWRRMIASRPRGINKITIFFFILKASQSAKKSIPITQFRKWIRFSWIKILISIIGPWTKVRLINCSALNLEFRVTESLLLTTETFFLLVNMNSFPLICWASC